MITLKDDQIKQFESDLKHFARNAYPFATRDSINAAAFKGREFAQENIKNQMINRNVYSQRSVMVNKAKAAPVSRQYATVGSVLDYMADQEFGATVTDPMIPTSVASGQSRNKSPRTRPVRRPNRKGIARWGSGNKNSPVVGKIRETQAKKKDFVYLKLRRVTGVFRVSGKKLEMIYRTDIKTVSIKPNPWLSPIVDQVAHLIPRLYKRSLVRQLKRQRLFGKL